MTATNPCDLQTKQWICLLLKAPGYATIVAFTTIHCAMFLERTAATIRPDSYEKTNCQLGYLASGTAILIAAAWIYFLFYDIDFTSNISYCMVTTGKNSMRLQITNYVLIAVDAVVCVGDFVLLKVNQRNAKM